MFLITETNTEVKLLIEEKDGKKHHFIEGVFMQAEQQNKNGRIYPSQILFKECGTWPHIDNRLARILFEVWIAIARI